jgi:hypothetical protein
MALVNQFALSGKRYHRKLNRQQRWALPYGAYTTAAGELVLHDRRYRPLYRRARDGTVERDALTRWVDDVVAHVWFYDDRCTPRTNRETLRRILAIRDRWELSVITGRAESVRWLLPSAWITTRKEGDCHHELD